MYSRPTFRSSTHEISYITAGTTKRIQTYGKYCKFKLRWTVYVIIWTRWIKCAEKMPRNRLPKFELYHRSRIHPRKRRYRPVLGRELMKQTSQSQAVILNQNGRRQEHEEDGCIFRFQQPAILCWNTNSRDVHITAWGQRISAQQLAFVNRVRKVNCKAIPVTEPWRLPHFLDKMSHRWRCACQPYTPAGRSLPPGRSLVLISVRGWVDPSAIVRLEGLGQLKNPITSLGNEPATFRLVA
jgi:hypothetical protein